MFNRVPLQQFISKVVQNHLSIVNVYQTCLVLVHMCTDTQINLGLQRNAALNTAVHGVARFEWRIVGGVSTDAPTTVVEICIKYRTRRQTDQMTSTVLTVTKK